MAVSAKRRWDYRGEGNRSIVVADVKAQLVYRMIKRPCRPTHRSLSPEEYMQIQCQSVNIRNQLQMIADYVANVMAPLIPSVFIVPPRLVDLPGIKICELSRSIESVRPAHRLNKELDPASRSALALPDFCFAPSPLPTKSQLPAISIEIKPKRGFIPTSRHISQDNSIKRDVCKFCLHNSLKVNLGMRSQSSRYCPIDLYSGNIRRMKHALHCLLETPQNNLRICKNGQEVFGEFIHEDLGVQLQDILSGINCVERNGLRRDRCISVFLDLVIKALLWCPTFDHQHRGSPVITCESQSVQYCANSTYKLDLDKDSADGAPPGCILDILLQIQRLDDLDIEGVILLYKQLKQYFLDTPECDRDRHLDGPYTKGSWEIPKPHTDHLSNVELIVQKLKEFLVSMTVQDCSILIALQPVNLSDKSDVVNSDSEDMSMSTSEQILVDSDSQAYRFSLRIIDLDPKPFDKIPKYFQQDHDILQAYRKAQTNGQPEQSDQS